MWLRFHCLSLPVFQPSVQAWLVLFWLMLYPAQFRLALRAAYKGNFLQCVPLFKQHKLPFSQAVTHRNLLPSARAKSTNSRALLVKHRADNSFSSRAPHFAGGSFKKFLLMLIFLVISILSWNSPNQNFCWKSVSRDTMQKDVCQAPPSWKRNTYNSIIHHGLLFPNIATNQKWWHFSDLKIRSCRLIRTKTAWLSFPRVFRDGRMVPKSCNNLIPAAPSWLLGSKTCASFSSAQEKQFSSVWVCNSCRESSEDKPGLIPTPMTVRRSSSFRYDTVP